MPTRQVWGIVIMAGAFWLAKDFGRDGLTRDEVVLCLGLAALGGVVFDTDKALDGIRAWRGKAQGDK